MVLPRADDGPCTRTIQEGDLVIVYESFQSIKFAYVNSKTCFQNRFGAFPQKDWIGKPFGVRVTSKPPQKGWVHLLAPTAELWTLALRHRTQILYVADIAMVVAGLDLRPGSTVLESGTGSGSLSHSLARAVAPTGKVRTFEFHPGRAQEAAAEFAKNGLGELVAVEQRNIEQDGFPEALAGCAQGVFLDLPAPWKVVPSAAASLAPDGRFCSFSPCIEQVQRTVEALDQNGFTDILTQEILLRHLEVSTEQLQTSFCTASSAARRGNVSKQHQKQQQQRRQQQQQHQQQQQQEGEQAGDGAGQAGDGAGQAGDGAGQAAGDKRKREDEGASAGTSGCEAGAAVDSCEQQEGAPSQQDAVMVDAAAAAAAGEQGGAPPPQHMVVVKPGMEARGHTGYLTFARRFVGGG